MSDYQHQLAEEAALWGHQAQKQAADLPPDWRQHRRLLHNQLLHTRAIDSLLAGVRHGMIALELGCGSGWLTLALAMRGAHALGIDISEPALDVARRYYQQVKHEVSGTVDYRSADLNTLDLPPNFYDLIVVKGTLHHLVRAEYAIDQAARALKPGGLLWVSDTVGDEAPLAVLLAAGFMFVLPTHISYREKLRGLRKFGIHSAGRVRASMQAEGMSPFEGAGRGGDHADWLALIRRALRVEKIERQPAFTGYLAHQVRLPRVLALPLLYTVRAADSALVGLRVLRTSGLVVWARKG